MDVTAVAASVSEFKQTQVQAEVSMHMLKKALEMQESMALQLLQALPQSAAVGSAAGGHINTYA